MPTGLEVSLSQTYMGGCPLFKLSPLFLCFLLHGVFAHLSQSSSHCLLSYLLQALACPLTTRQYLTNFDSLEDSAFPVPGTRKVAVVVVVQ